MRGPVRATSVKLPANPSAVWSLFGGAVGPREPQGHSPLQNMLCLPTFLNLLSLQPGVPVPTAHRSKQTQRACPSASPCLCWAQNLGPSPAGQLGPASGSPSFPIPQPLPGP